MAFAKDGFSSVLNLSASDYLYKIHSLVRI